MGFEIEDLYYEAAGIAELIDWCCVASENEAVSSTGLILLTEIIRNHRDKLEALKEKAFHAAQEVKRYG